MDRKKMKLLLLLAWVVVVAIAAALTPTPEPSAVADSRAAVQALHEQDARDNAASEAIGHRVATDPAR